MGQFYTNLICHGINSVSEFIKRPELLTTWDYPYGVARRVVWKHVDNTSSLFFFFLVAVKTILWNAEVGGLKINKFFCGQIYTHVFVPVLTKIK